MSAPRKSQPRPCRWGRDFTFPGKNPSMLKKMTYGIIASVVGGAILLTLESSFLVGEKSPDNALQTEAIRVVESIPGEGSRTPKVQVESELDELKELFHVASKINGYSPRNEEYSKIINQALLERKPEFAFAVAKEIYGSDPRNREYSKIISQCLSFGRYELAIKVADAVWGTTPRNKEYKKIIAAGLAKPKGSPISE